MWLRPPSEAIGALPSARRGARTGTAAALLAAALALPAALATAEAESAAEGAGPSDPGAEAAPPPRRPSVGLDALLRLPSGYDAETSSRRRGADESEWRSRFAEADGEVEEVKEALARARAEYDATASESEQWQVAPPGATNPQTSPLSFRLREEMRRLREELDRAEKRRRDLEIEANLAGVPEEWRQ